MPDDVPLRVTKIIADYTDSEPAGIKPETAIADLGDSLDFIEAVFELEDEFHIEIPDADTNRIDTVGDAIELVRRLTA